jgi:hypothetical protein
VNGGKYFLFTKWLHFAKIENFIDHIFNYKFSPWISNVSRVLPVSPWQHISGTLNSQFYDRGLNPANTLKREKWYD